MADDLRKLRADKERLQLRLDEHKYVIDGQRHEIEQLRADKERLLFIANKYVEKGTLVWYFPNMETPRGYVVILEGKDGQTLSEAIDAARDGE